MVSRTNITVTVKLTRMITGITASCNSIKLLAMPCRAAQDRRVTVQTFDKMRSTGEGNGNHTLHYSCLENPMNSMQTDYHSAMKNEMMPFAIT